MTLALAIVVNEGIVVATDGRLSLQVRGVANSHRAKAGMRPFSDHSRKLFLTPQGVAIATFGQADINGTHVSVPVDSLIQKELQHECDPKVVAETLLEHFSTQRKPIDTQFLVAGYEHKRASKRKRVFLVDIAGGSIESANPRTRQRDYCGVIWGGEGDIVQRLTQPVKLCGVRGKEATLPQFDWPWQFFAIEDAIAFAKFAIESTHRAMRFQARTNTVGGKLQAVVVQSNAAQWVHDHIATI